MLTFFYMNTILLHLCSRHVDWNMETPHGSVNLQQKGIATYISSASDVLRKATKAMRTFCPSLFPVLFFAVFQTLNHQVGELLDGTVDSGAFRFLLFVDFFVIHIELLIVMQLFGYKVNEIH